MLLCEQLRLEVGVPAASTPVICGEQRVMSVRTVADTPIAEIGFNDHEGPAIDNLFRRMCEIGASDLHLCVGSPPLVRKDGRIQVLDRAASPFSNEVLASLLHPIMPAPNRNEFRE